jgi:hypothetical protein
MIFNNYLSIVVLSIWIFIIINVVNVIDCHYKSFYSPSPISTYIQIAMIGGEKQTGHRSYSRHCIAVKHTGIFRPEVFRLSCMPTHTHAQSPTPTHTLTHVHSRPHPHTNTYSYPHTHTPTHAPTNSTSYRTHITYHNDGLPSAYLNLRVVHRHRLTGAWKNETRGDKRE